MMGQIRLNLPDELHRALKAKAAMQGVTLQQLILNCLKEVVGE